jgi:hypothetical protein
MLHHDNAQLSPQVEDARSSQQVIVQGTLLTSALDFEIYFLVADIILYLLFVSILFSTMEITIFFKGPNYITSICVYVSYH